MFEVTRVRRSIPLWAAGAALLLHLLGNTHYGFFRDELYFIICGRHPALGYVDQPPLVPWIAAATQVFGISLFALRLVPALSAAAVTYAATVLSRRLGADRFGQVLTAICVTLGSDLLLQGVLMTTDVFHPLVWTVAVLCILRLATGGDGRKVEQSEFPQVEHDFRDAAGEVSAHRGVVKWPVGQHAHQSGYLDVNLVPIVDGWASQPRGEGDRRDVEQ